jgi:hypothetical protein
MGRPLVAHRRALLIAGSLLATALLAAGCNNGTKSATHTTTKPSGAPGKDNPQQVPLGGTNGTTTTNRSSAPGKDNPQQVPLGGTNGTTTTK